MIVEATGTLEVVRIIVVDIVGNVVVITANKRLNRSEGKERHRPGIECLHAIFAEKNRFDLLQCRPDVSLVEHVWRLSDGKRERERER